MDPNHGASEDGGLAFLLLADQLSRWTKGSGARVEDYLARYRSLHHQREALLELIAGEYFLRRRDGEAPEIEEYRARFPQFADELPIQLELLDMMADGRLDTNVIEGPESDRAVVSSVTFDPGERFDVICRLGIAPTTVSYLAHDHLWDEPVVLKTVRRASPSQVAMLQREFHRRRNHGHANLAAYHELIAAGERWFLTMEYVEGQNLFDFVRDDEDISPAGGREHSGRGWLPRLRHALRQLVGAAASLHRSGGVHGDIRPSNIVVSSTSRLTLLDLGTPVDYRMGTLPRADVRRTRDVYMAPEQYDSGRSTPTGDLYAIGVVLYEVLTGEVPFAGTWTEIGLAKSLLDPPDPRHRAPGIPDDLADLCVELLSPVELKRPDPDRVLARLGESAERKNRESATARSRELFVGRHRELEEVRSLAEPCQHERSTIVVVHGSEGIGRTTFLQRAAREIRRSSGAVVIEAGCSKRELVVLGLWDQIAHSMVGELERRPEVDLASLLRGGGERLSRHFPAFAELKAFGEGDGGNVMPPKFPHADRRRGEAMETFVRLIHDLSSRHGLVLLVDDLEKGDDASTEALLELFVEQRVPRLLLVASVRTEELVNASFLKTLGRGLREDPSIARCHSLALGPLSNDAMGQVIASQLERGEESTRRADDIAREVAGNPSLVPLVGALHHPRETKHVLGAGVIRSLDERLTRLSAEERVLLETIAASREPLAQRDALELAEITTHGRRILARLEHWRLLRTSGPFPTDPVELYHPWIRLHLLHGMSLADWLVCQRRLEGRRVPTRQPTRSPNVTPPRC
ncbi:Serine/threonine-protein kinase PrkC [Planctomycetes bacterium Pan216]|uniref:Serine/threonine-protein kinase PrkC n=1 Tax=Kolteria novifilia TaxID=2527975 RepID=A0A518B0I1_9BACT|nr:Serine/threonine-protein kinase PrkC [Planctomycetes bacterium Pan216]